MNLLSIKISCILIIPRNFVNSCICKMSLSKALFPLSPFKASHSATVFVSRTIGFYIDYITFFLRVMCIPFESTCDFYTLWIYWKLSTKMTLITTNHWRNFSSTYQRTIALLWIRHIIEGSEWRGVFVFLRSIAQHWRSERQFMSHKGQGRCVRSNCIFLVLSWAVCWSRRWWGLTGFSWRFTEQTPRGGRLRRARGAANDYNFVKHRSENDKKREENNQFWQQWSS